MTRLLSMSACLLAMGAAACGTQTDDDYQGESLYQMKGTVVSTRSATPEADAAVLWDNFATDGADTVVGQRLHVSNSFPSNFTMDLYTPPPAEALNEGLFAVGIILAVRHDSTDADLSGFEENAEDIVLGGSSENIIMYLAHDIDPDSQEAQYLGGIHTAGYHLLEVVPDDDDEDSFDSLVPAADGATVNVTITPDGAFHVPNIT